METESESFDYVELGEMLSILQQLNRWRYVLGHWTMYNRHYYLEIPSSFVKWCTKSPIHKISDILEWEVDDSVCAVYRHKPKSLS